MRITGGQYRGRVINAPKGKDVRPTSDKVRQAVFNIINSYELADEPYVLDGFCGTGALGLEALSRFAAGGIFIDKSAESLKYARANIDALGLSEITDTIRQDVSKAGVRPSKIPPADLVFLDPPYRQDLLLPSLNALSQNGWIADKALCIFECEKDLDIALPEKFSPRDDRLYGDSRIFIVRYEL